MSFARIALVSVLFLGAVAISPAPVVTAEALAGEKYFGCPTGYTFQTSGSAARCYLAGSTSTADIQCGLNFKTIDQFNGGKDGCQSKLNVVSNYTCPNGFSPKVQPGPDVCTKAATPSIIAPAVEKSL